MIRIKYFFLLLLYFPDSVFAFTNSYVDEIEQIGILVCIACFFFSSEKYRVLMIGTSLGLVFTYFTYKYVIPFLFKLLEI